MAFKIMILLLYLTPLCITAQKVATSYKFKILTYGLQDYSRRNASNLVQLKWKIKIQPVAGCIVTQELVDSVKKKNDKTYKLIAKEYGKDWEVKFDTEVEAEYKIETQIDSLVKKQTYIVNKEIVNPLPGSPFPMYPINDKGNYIVMVNNYNRQWKKQKLYRLKVNYKKIQLKF